MANTTKFNLVGNRYGKLLVLGFKPTIGKYNFWTCKCDCGKEKDFECYSIRSGNTKSCGCLAIEIASKPKKHGMAGKNRTSTYNSWAGMMDRCEWGFHPEIYEKYGAIGIRVDKRWHEFSNFLSDMGERPKGTSIDRINGELGYSKENCRWANRFQQAMNRKVTVKVKYQGNWYPAMILAENFGISMKALSSRKNRRNGDWIAAFNSFGIECDAYEKGSFNIALGSELGVLFTAKER